MKPLKVRISITLDDPIYQKIKGLAEYDDRSVSSYINLALRDHLEQLEREGKIFVFSPRIPTVSRIERDCDALKHFYEHGYQQAKKRHAELQAYLEKWQI